MTHARETTRMTQDRPLHPETTAVRAGRDHNGDALAPVLWASSAFVTPTVDDARQMATTTSASHFYSRYGNPTVADFEQHDLGVPLDK